MVHRPFKVATYNIHRCYGTDGVYDPSRIAAVLCELDADIIGLQEVDATLTVTKTERRRGREAHLPDTAHLPTPKGQTQLEYLAEATGMHLVEGFLLHRHWGLFGNALLTRYPVTDIRRIDLTVRGGRERRGGIDVGMKIHGHEVRIVVAHLGVTLWERHFQVGRLLKALGEDRTPHMIMMGDFNLWVSMLPKLRRFYNRLGHAPLARTFPSRLPILSLDRIWAQPAQALQKVAAHRTPLSAVASDHLPLMGWCDFSNARLEKVNR